MVDTVKNEGLISAGAADIGFDGWVPIFAGGRQLDSQGIEHDADALIDRAIELFDPEYHEAPITVGHPQDNSPAFGWVKSLKKVTARVKGQGRVAVLMARFKDVVPELARAVREGLYKKRSASFYPDGRLRHVGFLGAMPPAVKGLADLKFEENGQKPIFFADALPLSFSSQHFSSSSGGSGQRIDVVGEIFKSIREFFQHPVWGNQKNNQEVESMAEEQGIDLADSRFNEHLDKQVKQQCEMFLTEFKEKLEERLETEFNERLEAKFNEAVGKIKEEQGHEEAALDFAQGAKQEARRQEIRHLIDQGLSSGQILPAWEKMGLIEFMEGLDSSQGLDFSERENSEGQSQYQWFKNFLAELPKTVNFGEFASRAKNIAAFGNAGQQLSDLIASKIKNNPKLNYTSAFSEVQKERPDLVREYEQEIHKSA